MNILQNKIDRAFLLSDLHFGVKNNNKEWLELQLNYFNNFFIPLLKEKKQKNDILFILGDIFDSRQTLNIIVLNKVLELFNTLSKIINIIIIIGNHDTANKDNNEITSVEIFKNIKNIYIVKDYLYLEDKLFISWQNNYKNEIDIIKKYENVKYVFSHSEIQGTSYNKYQKQENGNKLEDYGNNIQIYSGHIHYRQEYKNLMYIGSPYHLTRNDIDNKKGFYILDFENSTKEFIENKYSPIYISINLEDFYNKKVEELIQIVTNNFVDINIDNNIILKFSINKLIDLLSKYARNINILINNNIIDIDNNINIEENSTDFLDINNLLKLYLDNTSYDDKLKNNIIKYINKLQKEN